jgi:DNA gyrase subunit A
LTSEDPPATPPRPPSEGAPAPGTPTPISGNGIAARLLARHVEQELKASFLDYAMSVIVSRALPDVRDGLKPVHRRVLYAMGELGVRSDRPRRKSALIVGEVMGKYHPHGDMAIYDTLVRMAQDFSLRYPLVDGQGNFGSVDGDNAAAMRYTEARLSKIAEELLADLEKETVDFVPNYDASLEEPTVLPAKFPNLLVNGADGIAVGMATKIPPHNLGEVIDATIHLIDRPDAGLADLLQHVRGPDFPTGGILMGRAGVVEAYSTGRGRLVVRGKVHTETLAKERRALIVTELPYQVNKANLLVAIAELVKDKRIEGIHDLRDESDRDGMRVVIELKKDADADVVLNQLYTHTDLQASFGALNIALVNQRPVQLPLKRFLEEFVEHRVVVITRRTKYELRKAEERAHILEGLLIALDNIDEVIQLIRKSRAVEDAQRGLIARFALSEAQAKAILDMRLAKLASLEIEQVKQEHAELLERIAYYKRLLGSRQEILSVLKKELLEVKAAYPSPRRTEIVESEAEEIHHEALIAEHEVVVTITAAGYTKRIPLQSYRSQGRGGKGVIGTEVREEDAVIDLFTTSTHNYIMFFTTHGRCFWLKAYQIPEGSRYSRGKAIVNLLPKMEPGERVTAAIPVKEFSDDRFVFFATKKGTVKRTVLSDFKNVRAAGIRAISLDEGDAVLGVALTDGHQDIVLAKASGKAVRFKESEARPMGRTAAGVRGVDLEPGTRGAVVENDEVVALAHLDGTDGDLLTIKANGRGKRTPVADYPVKHRGTMGVITIDIEETVDGQTIQSPVVGMVHVRPHDQIMVSTQKGVVIRIPVDDIPQKGRGAQGNWIIRTEAGDRVVAVARVAPEVEAAAPASAPAAA